MGILFMRKSINHEYYQTKGFKFHDKLVEFSNTANGGRFYLKCIGHYQSDKSVIEAFQGNLPKNLPKTKTMKAVNQEIERLQEQHSKEMTNHQKITLVLHYDYYAEKFDGKGKKLLTQEIDDLKKNTHLFSFKNKKLLKLMNSLSSDMDELQQVQRQLIKQQRKAQMEEAQIKEVEELSTAEYAPYETQGKRGIEFFSHKEQPVIKNARMSLELDGPQEFFEEDMMDDGPVGLTC